LGYPFLLPLTVYGYCLANRPTRDGKLAGAVCIKSVKENVQHYWESVYNTITKWHI
jgi:hypothetical protein